MIFPVFLLSKKSRPHFCASASKLKITNALAIKNGFFNNARIIDCTGQCFEIKSVCKKKGAGFLWGFNIFFNQKIEIEIEYEKLDKVYDLHGVKNIILKKYFFENMISGEEVMNELRDSSTIKDFFDTYSKLVSKI